MPGKEEKFLLSYRLQQLHSLVRLNLVNSDHAVSSLVSNNLLFTQAGEVSLSKLHPGGSSAGVLFLAAPWGVNLRLHPFYSEHLLISLDTHVSSVKTRQNDCYKLTGA